MDKIFIRELSFDILIGVLPHEHVQKQKIIINLEIEIDSKKAAESDELKDTIDYAAIASRITEYVEQTQFRLLETLANKIANLILKEFLVSYLKLELIKPAAIPNAKAAGLIIERKR